MGIIIWESCTVHGMVAIQYRIEWKIKINRYVTRIFISWSGKLCGVAITLAVLRWWSSGNKVLAPILVMIRGELNRPMHVHCITIIAWGVNYQVYLLSFENVVAKRNKEVWTAAIDRRSGTCCCYNYSLTCFYSISSISFKSYTHILGALGRAQRCFHMLIKSLRAEHVSRIKRH